MNQVIGNLDKMKTSCPENGGVVEYSLVMGGKPVLDLNPLIGKRSWSFNNKINCVHCGIPIKKYLDKDLAGTASQNSPVMICAS